MDFREFAVDFQDTFLNSNLFPYRTGQLKNNFFTSTELTDDGLTLHLMQNPIVKYGKILEEAPSIRYGIKSTEKGFYRQISKFRYVKKRNKHFRYIERIIEKDMIPYIEDNYDAKFIGI